MTRHTPLQLIKEAKQIAKDHNCYVTEKGGKYSVYRKSAIPTYLGTRSTPAALRTLVCKVTNFR